MPKITVDADAFATFSEDDKKHGTRNEDGSYTIDVRPTAVVTQFRDNNVRQAEQLESATAKVKSIASTLGVELADLGALDAEAVNIILTDLIGIKKQVDDGKLVADTSLESAISQRITEAKKEFEGRETELLKVNSDLKSQVTKANEEMNNYILETQITQAVLDPSSGLRPEALPDILNRARNATKVTGDKQLQFLDGEGKTRYGADAEKPMTKMEWLKELSEKAPHFSKTSRGGGAETSDESGLDLAASSQDPGSFVEARLAQAAKTGSAY